MVPEWFIAMLNSCACERCGKPLNLEDIAEVGVAYPDARCRYDRRPVTFARTKCSACGATCSIQSVEPKADLLRLVNDVYEVIELDRQATEEPSPFQCDCCAKEPKSGPFELPNEGVERRIRPSRRNGHPTRPISDDEVARFVRRLDRTSMQRRAKSFRAFLARLGIEPDREPPKRSDGTDESGEG